MKDDYHLIRLNAFCPCLAGFLRSGGAATPSLGEGRFSHNLGKIRVRSSVGLSACVLDSWFRPSRIPPTGHLATMM